MPNKKHRPPFSGPTVLRYPTEQQSQIWLARRQGIAPSDIADKMGVTRAFVSKSLRSAEKRIEDLINHTAQINRIQLHHISSRHGMGIGYCAAYKSETIIAYSSKMGIQVWFDHHGDCDSCADFKECTRFLSTMSKEWKIPLASNAEPTRVAQHLFGAIEKQLDWID
ncbi:MAG: hypothetical protein P1Q69_15195 [Candidatus Thorarchaeota archaeon]|nr:hypothetical protein [Candidatus Thorarchaeota archaeon]